MTVSDSRRRRIIKTMLKSNDEHQSRMQIEAGVPALRRRPTPRPTRCGNLNPALTDSQGGAGSTLQVYSDRPNAEFFRLLVSWQAK
jgi:hypothetical protein